MGADVLEKAVTAVKAITTFAQASASKRGDSVPFKPPTFDSTADIISYLDYRKEILLQTEMAA